LDTETQLKSNLLQPNEITQAYTIDKIKADITILEDKTTHTQVSIKLANNTETLSERIIRKYHVNKKLYSNDNNSQMSSGKVAEHEWFVLKEAYKSQQISSIIQIQELALYRKNEIKQIQLKAGNEGITYWPKNGFKFESLEKEEEVRLELYLYFSTTKGLEPEKAKKLSRLDFKSLKKELLIDKAGNFFDRFISENTWYSFNMYKDVV